MPAEALPFADTQASGLEQLGGASPLSVNSFVDDTGTIRQRPGISAWDEFPSAIPNASAVTAMCPWGEYLVYATEDRKLFAWIGEDTVLSLSDATAATQLAGPDRPVFLPLRTKVVVTGGGAPQKWTGLGLSARLGGSPPSLTHVAGIATRIVGSVADVSGIFRWSGLGDTAHETWDALNYAEAESKHDRLVALHENGGEIFAFGSRTVEVHVPDPYTGFARSRALDIAPIAPYSITPVDANFFMFERLRRFVMTDGRGFDDVSSKFLKRTLDAYSTVDDAWGVRLQIDQWDACVTFFPTEGKGLIFDLNTSRWAEWRAFGSSGWQSINITSAVAWPERNLLLVGLSTGQIAKLDASAYTDLSNPIKVELVTGFVSHGTKAWKLNRSTRFMFKRGVGSYGGTAPQVAISWRDDGGAFCPQTMVSLGTAGDYDPIVEIHSSGTYRQRQWKLEYDSSAELAFIGAEEDFEVLT